MALAIFSALGAQIFVSANGGGLLPARTRGDGETRSVSDDGGGLYIAETLIADGRLTGMVVDKNDAGAAGVQVVVINQVTRKISRKKSGSDGRFSFSLSAGAYRLMVEAPYIARFLRPGNLPERASVLPGTDDKVAYRARFFKGDEKARKGIEGRDGEIYNPYQENIIVEGGQETIVDVPVEQRDLGQLNPGPDLESYGAEGRTSVPSPPQTLPDRKEIRDRWRVGFPEYDRYGDRGARGRDVPFRRASWYNPYDLNVVKGDFPIIGQKTFFILSAVSGSEIEQNRTPKGSGVSAANPGSAEFFGRPELLIYKQFFQVSFELFHGDSTFKPRDWAIKISPTFSLPNYARARENGVLTIDVRRGTKRTDTHFSLEEAFGEVKLFDTNANYDFVSARVGIQPFNADFRGFLFTDNNLGARLFGGFDNNRYQFNVAGFYQLEKDTNSGLNRFDKRNQFVYVANFFRQDFGMKGYTLLGTVAYNDDRSTFEYDRNGFLVRPALIGDVRQHKVQVGYVGIHGDGHLGKLNLSNHYYYAFGRDSRNPIAGRRTDIRSNMVAVEASMDRDYLRPKLSFFWAQGDKNPSDDRATGFDSILDDPNFIGGQFSFWNRNGIALTQTGVGLVQPFSILPSLRSSKSQGQANFVNPGIFIYNAGLDVEVTQKLKAIFNISYSRFHRTEPLEYVLFQNNIRHDIGIDYSLGLVYRPFLINNVQFTFGASLLQTGKGFRDIYRNRDNNCPPELIEFCSADNTVIDATKPLYSLFGQLKFIF